MDPNSGVLCPVDEKNQQVLLELSTRPKSPPKSPDEERIGSPPESVPQAGEVAGSIGISQPPSTTPDSPILPPQPVVFTPPPTPMDTLSSSNLLPPFLTKTYDMVEDRATDEIVSWTQSNTSFVVWDPAELARDVLPKYFKHNNFSSFVRQLNTYGFRKVDPDQWEFYNKWFIRGQKHLLQNIHRRKPERSQVQQHGMGPTSVGACVEVGKFGLEGEIEQLKRDKNVLMLELVRLRRNQELMDNRLQVANSRLGVMEQQQQTVMTFLAEFVKNPSFLAHFVQRNDKSQQRLTVRKKRRLPQKQNGGLNGPPDANAGQLVQYHQFQPMAQDATCALLTELSNDADVTSTGMDTAEEGIGEQDLKISKSAFESFLRDLNAHIAKTPTPTHHRTSVLTLTEVGQVPIPMTMMATVLNGPEPPVAHQPQDPGSGIPTSKDGSAAQVASPANSTISKTSGSGVKQEYAATIMGPELFSTCGSIMAELRREPLLQVDAVVNQPSLSAQTANGCPPVSTGGEAAICPASDGCPSAIDHDSLLENLGDGLVGGEALEGMNLARTEGGDQQVADSRTGDHVHGLVIGDGDIDMNEEQGSNTVAVSNAVTLFDDATFWANLLVNQSDEADSNVPLSMDDGERKEGVGYGGEDSSAAGGGSMGERDLMDSTEVEAQEEDRLQEGQTLWWLPSQLDSEQLDNIVEQMGQLAPLHPS